MKSIWIIPVLVVLILGTLGLSYDAFAGHGGNSGGIGCENANPNAKACESNPNTEPDVLSINPTSGSKGDAFTITDPEGRMQTGDVVVFTNTGVPEPGLLGFTLVATNNVISPDGTTLTGPFPSGVQGVWSVSVKSSDFSEVRFSGIFITETGTCQPNCG